VIDMLNEKSIGAVIFRKENKVVYYLLLHYEGGHWDFVKGNTEENETDMDTLRRETLEETGIKDLRILDGFKEVVKWYYRRGGQLVNKEVIFYVAETETKEIKLSFEHKGFFWLPIDKALKQVTFNNAKQLLKKADELIKKEKSLKDFSD